MISQASTRGRVALIACVAAAVCFVGAGRVARADEAAEMKSILEQYSESIVSIKTVTQMRMPGSGNEQDTEAEVAGVMVSSDGIVICSNMMMNGPMGMVMRMLGNRVPGLNVSSEIKSVKVVLGPNDEELDAKILARDEDLDLAWIQIEKPDREFKAIDLTKSVEADLGSRVMGVRRMGTMFDRAAVAAVATVCGQTERPRKLWVVQEPITAVVGLPMFTGSGELVGVVITQMPSADEAGGGANPLGMLSNLTSMQEGVAGLILPAADVVKATERAKAGASEGDSDDKADAK